jgi:hypothetical protein
MTTYYYPSYMAMSESKLNRHLIKRKYPDELRHTIVELIGKQRRHRANERRKRGALTPLWDHLMLPLSGEIRNTHAMLRYTAKDPERNAARTEALNAYLTVTTTLYNRFKELRKANEKSPLRIAKEKDPPLPNGGEHWTDWIPDHIRARTLTLFDAIPPMRYAKTKKPFARTMPPDVHAKLKPRIARRLNSDLAVLETDLMLMELNPTSEGFDNDEEKNQALLAQRARVERARKARDILDAMPETEALPVTWHGIIVE